MARITLLLSVLTALVALLGGFRYVVDTIREYRWRKRGMGKWLMVVALCVLPSVSDAAILEVGAGQTYTTIQACINAMSAGDTCNVHSGTYTEQLTLGSGTAGNLKRIVCDVANACTVQSTSSPVVLIGGADYWFFDDINVTYNGSGAAARGFSGTSLIQTGTISNLTITIASGTGSGFGINISSSRSLTIDNVTVTITPTSGGYDGMQILLSSNLTITNCIIQGNASESTGLLQDGLVVSGTNIIIRGNQLLDGWQYDGHPDGIVVQGDGDDAGNPSDTIEISRNIVKNWTQGIYIDAIHNPITNVKVINNIVYETAAFRYGGEANKMNCIVLDGENIGGSAAYLLQVEVSNNLLDCRQIALLLSRIFTGSTIPIKNNIFVSPGFTGAIYSAAADTAALGVSANYNYYASADASPIRWNNTAMSLATFSGTHSQDINRRTGTTTTLDLTNISANDYTLKATSDNIDYGTDLSSSFTTDFSGNTRSGTWDMGPYEYGAGSSPGAPILFISQAAMSLVGAGHVLAAGLAAWSVRTQVFVAWLEGVAVARAIFWRVRYRRAVKRWLREAPLMLSAPTEYLERPTHEGMRCTSQECPANVIVAMLPRGH